MLFNLHPETIINTLKNCFKWKNDETIKASKLTLNIFCDFVRQRLIPKNDKSAKAFDEFKKHPNNSKLEGKLETWIEIGLEQGDEIKAELEKKMEKVGLFYEKNLNKENIIVEEKEEDDIKNENETKSETKSETEEITEIFLENNNRIENMKNPILVTWDFSEVAKYALQHALQFIDIVEGDIYLLHIAKKEKDIPDVEKELKKVVEETYLKYNVKINTLVQTGNIFKTITEIANQNDAKLVIMGTHGVKGMQKFTGSWALKVIAGTNTPFVVIQNPPERKIMKNVVFSIDHTKENKQKLKQAKILAKNNNLKFYLTVPAEITNPQIIKNTNTNLNYVKSFFKQSNVDFDVVFVEGTDNALDATLKFINENETDLIIVLTTKNINIQDYVLGADEQRIIANDNKIPVMCINPKKVKFASYSTFANA
ncbi:MAG: universal stress protein [Bacteroidales bacterium]|nr:universal stress protein [Bacteroidales bacterium]MBN2758034.1 universal stress protein [Bacteroidales bacterium]